MSEPRESKKEGGRDKVDVDARLDEEDRMDEKGPIRDPIIIRI